jgi:hypothetical protein
MIKTESTFFTKPIRWDSGVRRGFIVKPISTADTSWGEPYEDEAGNAILPGTPGGPHDRAFLGIKNGQWKMIRKDKWQEAGNIDWKGPWVTDAMDKRVIVTWNGPIRRYWNSGLFRYDDPSEDDKLKHRVYANGRIVGLSPYPILSACFQQYTHTDPNTGIEEDQKWLIVVGKAGREDVVLATRNIIAITREDIDPEIFAENIVVGTDPLVDWIPLGSGNGATDEITTVEPEAPWFFNVDGTQARTVRRCEYAHSEHAETGILDDTMYRELRLSVDLLERRATFIIPDYADAAKEQNRWTSQIRVERSETEYIQPAIEASDGEPHRFTENLIDHNNAVWGQSKVCVDFEPDLGKWVYGWLYGTHYQTIAEAWSIGTDDGATYGATNPNTGGHDGPQPVPDPYIPSVGNHYEEQALGSDGYIDFIINTSSSTVIGTALHAITLCWTKTGDASQLAGGEDDPENPYFAFWDSYDTYLHYVDIRSGLIAGYVWLNTYIIEGGPFIITEELEWAALHTDPAEGITNEEGSIDNSHYFMYNRPYDTRYVGWPADYTRAEMETWPTDFLQEDYVYVNYSARMPTANDDESLYAPAHLDAWHAPWNTEYPKANWVKLNLVELLYADEGDMPFAVYGSTEKDEHLAHMQYYDSAEKAVVSKAHSWNVEGDPIAADGPDNDNFIPGGLL